MLFKDIYLVGFRPWLSFIWKAHLTNWFWRDRLKRRLIRQNYFLEMKLSYLRKYIPYIKNLKADNNIDSHEDLENEKMFTLWFQGIENAPHVVKQCVDSVKKFYGSRLVILDDNSIPEYITLPEYVIDKKNQKIMGPANFSDIVRLELLYKYGGYWFDATDFMMRPVPDLIKDSDFFMFVSSDLLNPHMFVANCFIRAKKGDPLLKMWRDLVLEYWKNENKNVDYFLVHYLLRLLVTYNDQAKALFEKMPKLLQDPLHLLWFKYGDKPFESQFYDEIKKQIFIQKLSYRKLKFANTEIVPGSTKDYIINNKFKPTQP